MKKLISHTSCLFLVLSLLSCGTQKPLTDLKPGKREMVIYFPSKSQRLQRAGEGTYADIPLVLSIGLETKKLFFEGRAKELFKGQSKRVAVTTDSFLIETRNGILTGTADEPAQLRIPAGTTPIYVRITQSYTGETQRISGATGVGFVSQDVKTTGDNLALVSQSFFLSETERKAR